MLNYVLISLFAPLVAFMLAGIFAFSKKSNFIGIVCSILIILSAVCSFALLEFTYGGHIINVYLGDFIGAGSFDSYFTFLIDSVSAVMMTTVGIVAAIVHIYSIGYMEHDEKFNKFFSFLGLFVFSMLILVMSDNFLGLFIGWEGVGLCSWLLIGFWYDKDNNSWCANEAFIMNRVADLGILLGIFLIYTQVGSLRYAEVFDAAAGINPFILSVIAILLFIGAMGKSAQFPFHTWLADAMAGPTPVSALIHAATMVTAGVYLVIRANVIFAAVPAVSYFIVCLGAFVAVFAASMALVHDDLKKIIAYSTLSQLGYMFVAAGFGAYWIALFHLMTHAFFKSLLFLCAGNVMHAMNDDLNIKKMGGLYKFMKPTAILMIIGSIALCGYYPFSGFFSKDKILEVAFNEGDLIIWVTLLTGAIFTAFYSFRLIMLVFFGKQKFTHTPHEAKNFVIISLIPLGILAVISGFFENKFTEFVLEILPGYDFGISKSTAKILIIITFFAILSSTIFAVFAYTKQIFSPKIEQNLIYKILKNQYFIPKFYDKVIVAGYFKISEFCEKIDNTIIDTTVDLIARYILKTATVTNKMQSGNLSLMLRLMVIGFVILLISAFVI